MSEYDYGDEPWLESWEHISGAWPDNVTIKGNGRERVADVWHGNDSSALIAAAPLLVRELIRAEWSAGETGGECPACDGSRPSPGGSFSISAEPRLGHYAGCDLDAALNAAGLSLSTKRDEIRSAIAKQDLR